MEDFIFEESVCLLLRASWFKPLEAVERVSYHDIDNYDFDIPPEYEEEEDDDDDDRDEFLHGSSLRLGNRRWGDNGFVRSGRQEARPAQHKHRGGGQASSASESSSSSSSSREPKEKTSSSAATGRRAKRAMKREAANKAAEAVAAAKHDALLVRLGRK